MSTPLSVIATDSIDSWTERGYSTKCVTLCYPPHWKIGAANETSASTANSATSSIHSTRHCSMFAHTAAREAVQWLVEMGLVHRNHMDQFMHRVRAMNVVLYGGASLPLGNYAHTLLHTRMVLLWLLWDDVIVEKMPADAAEHILYVNHIAQMDNIMHGHVVIDPMINLITVHDRFAYAWQDIMQTIMQHNYISAEYVQRFGDAFVEWIKYANEEKMQQQQHNHQQQQLQHYETSHNDSTIIDTDKARQRDEQWEAYVTQRKKTIGMVNTALLLEIAVGFSIPSDIWRSAPCQRIIDLSALLVGLGNELASLAKDIRHFQNISATGSTTATTHTITTDSPMSADATTTSSSTTAASSPAIQDACWTNLILIYSQLYHVRFDEAVNHILTQHNNAVQEFDNVVENWLTLHRHHRPQQQQQQRQEHAHANMGDPSEHTKEAITDHDQALKHHTHSNDNADENVGERPITSSPDQSSMCTSGYMTQWNERLRAFVQYLRYCVYGFAHWHTSTERYMSHCAVDHHTRSVYRIHCS